MVVLLSWNLYIQSVDVCFIVCVHNARWTDAVPDGSSISADSIEAFRQSNLRCQAGGQNQAVVGQAPPVAALICINLYVRGAEIPVDRAAVSLTLDHSGYSGDRICHLYIQIIISVVSEMLFKRIL